MNCKKLSLCNVHKSFDQAGTLRTIIHDLSVTFFQTKSYAITGISGSGKSTLLHIIAGLEKPTDGIVTYNGVAFTDLSQKAREQFLNKEIGLVFQSSYLINELSVIENVIIKGIVGGFDPDWCLQQACALLREMGIADKAQANPTTLSGGQQQRVALARALLIRPNFLLADEPTGNLDESTGNAIIKIILQYQKQYGMGLIVSSHDPVLVTAMDEVMTLQNGFLTHSKGIVHAQAASVPNTALPT